MRIQSLAIGSLAACVAGDSMLFPKPRNQYYDLTCPQCANGDGVCGGLPRGEWPADSEADVWLGNFTSPRTVLTPGGTVEVEYYFISSHKGHFVMEICFWDGIATKITERCFQRLERDVSSTKFSPYNPNAPTIAYLPGSECQRDYGPSNPLKTRFKVPHVTAERAILRWYWQTGNDCISDPSIDESNVASTLLGWKLDTCSVETCSSTLPSCGPDCPHVDCIGQKFKNCADIKVVSGGPMNVNSSNAEIVD
jgi:hypothetical protein